MQHLFEKFLANFEPTAKLHHRWQLSGGYSSEMWGLQIEYPAGQLQKIVLRRHADFELEANPELTAQEFRLLQILKQVGLKTPRPLFLQAADEFFAKPYMFIEFVDGAPEFKPCNVKKHVQQMAELLANLHQKDYVPAELAFLPQQKAKYAAKFKTCPARLDDSIGEGQIRAVLEKAWPLSQFNRATLLHGDFWPGNVLWRAEQPAAIVDWEDAEFGDPLADVANGRLAVLWAFGTDAMCEFTKAYQAANSLNLANLPYWDLCAALRPAFKLAGWAETPQNEAKMRAEHAYFVTQAFNALSEGKSYNLERKLES